MRSAAFIYITIGFESWNFGARNQQRSCLSKQANSTINSVFVSEFCKLALNHRLEKSEHRNVNKNLI